MRNSVAFCRSLTAQWMGRLGLAFMILADCILEKIKDGERIFADEATLPTLVLWFGKNHDSVAVGQRA